MKLVGGSPVPCTRARCTLFIYCCSIVWGRGFPCVVLVGCSGKMSICTGRSKYGSSKYSSLTRRKLGCVFVRAFARVYRRLVWVSSVEVIGFLKVIIYKIYYGIDKYNYLMRFVKCNYLAKELIDKFLDGIDIRKLLGVIN